MSDIRLTPEQTADRLGISKYAVYKLCKPRVATIEGRRVELPPELGHFRFGSKIVIPETEVTAYEQRSFRPAVTVLADRRAELRVV